MTSTAVRDPDAAPEHTGIMVALALTPEQAQNLAVDPAEHEGAVEADDLHITLAYLGDVAEVEEPGTFLIDLLTVTREVARTHGPVEGEISGAGRFTLADGGAFYASYDAPDLSALREELVTACTDAGLPVRRDHGFTPHITLAYLGSDEDVALGGVESRPLVFADLTVAFGASRIPVPLRKRDSIEDVTPLVEGDTPDTTAPNSPMMVKKFVPFRKGTAKGDAPGVARGAYVTLGSEKGRVDLVVTSGKVPGVENDVEGSAADPAIRVVVYEKTGDGWKATGRKIAAKAKAAKTSFPLKSPKAGGGARAKKSLVELLADHEDAVAAEALPGSAVPSGAVVAAVFDRGVSSWPGPDLTALGAEEWGAGRVEMFLKVARGEVEPRAAGYVRDLDLLPAGHPWRD